MNFFDICSLEEAKNRINEHFKGYTLQTQDISILEALDKVLAKDIISSEDVPSFNRSTVDGYAIVSKDSNGASDFSPTLLQICGESKMGQNCTLKLHRGQAIYVPTGGMIPDGCDSVVMIEYTEILNDMLAIHKPTCFGENITWAGDDVKKQTRVLTAGKQITPYDIGLLASLGITTVKVYQSPSFYLISTGDEIVDIDKKTNTSQIRDINSYALSALIKKSGGIIKGHAIVPDDFQKIKDSVTEAIKLADIVIMSGGSSVGELDFTHKVLNSFSGKGVFVHGIAIKPGKPTIVSECEGKIVFGLPGHPASALILYNVLVDTFISHIMNNKKIKPKAKAKLKSNIHSSPGKTTFQMVNIEYKEDFIEVEPLYRKSGLITLLSNTQGYIIIDENQEGLYKDTYVDLYFL